MTSFFLSPGAKPIKPGLDGIESSRIFTLRTVEDTLKIKNYLTTYRPKIRRGGWRRFHRIEVAENLKESGVDVTLVEASDQLMAPFDRDMASFIHAQVRKNGVHLMLGHTVEGFAIRIRGLLSD